MNTLSLICLALATLSCFLVEIRSNDIDENDEDFEHSVERRANTDDDKCESFMNCMKRTKGARTCMNKPFKCPNKGKGKACETFMDCMKRSKGDINCMGKPFRCPNKGDGKKKACETFGQCMKRPNTKAFDCIGKPYDCTPQVTLSPEILKNITIPVFPIVNGTSTGTGSRACSKVIRRCIFKNRVLKCTKKKTNIC